MIAPVPVHCSSITLNTLLCVPFYILLYVGFEYRKKENNRVIQFSRESVHHENWLWYVACVYLAVCGFCLPCCMWLLFILLYMVLVYLAVCSSCIYSSMAFVYLTVCGFSLPCFMWLLYILLYVAFVYIAVCGFCKSCFIWLLYILLYVAFVYLAVCSFCISC